MSRPSWTGLLHEVAVVIAAAWLPIFTLALGSARESVADEFDYWIDVVTVGAHLVAVVCLVHFMGFRSSINKDWVRRCGLFLWRDIGDGLGLAIVWVCLANAWLAIAVNTGLWRMLNDIWQVSRSDSDAGASGLSVSTMFIELLLVYPEEILCRWYLVPRLSLLFGVTGGVLMSAVFFALPHIGLGLNACVTSLIYGILAGAWYAWRRRLSGLIIGHVLTNIWFGYL